MPLLSMPACCWQLADPDAGEQRALYFVAKNFYRLRNQAIATRYARQFPKLTLFTLNEVFGLHPSPFTLQHAR